MAKWKIISEPEHMVTDETTKWKVISEPTPIPRYTIIDEPAPIAGPTPTETLVAPEEVQHPLAKIAVPQYVHEGEAVTPEDEFSWPGYIVARPYGIVESMMASTAKTIPEIAGGIAEWVQYGKETKGRGAGGSWEETWGDTLINLREKSQALFKPPVTKMLEKSRIATKQRLIAEGKTTQAVFAEIGESAVDITGFLATLMVGGKMGVTRKGVRVAAWAPVAATKFGSLAKTFVLGTMISEGDVTDRILSGLYMTAYTGTPSITKGLLPRASKIVQFFADMGMNMGISSEQYYNAYSKSKSWPEFIEWFGSVLVGDAIPSILTPTTIRQLQMRDAFKENTRRLNDAFERVKLGVEPKIEVPSPKEEVAKVVEVAKEKPVLPLEKEVEKKVYKVIQPPKDYSKESLARDLEKSMTERGIGEQLTTKQLEEKTRGPVRALPGGEATIAEIFKEGKEEGRFFQNLVAVEKMALVKEKNKERIIKLKERAKTLRENMLKKIRDRKEINKLKKQVVRYSKLENLPLEYKDSIGDALKGYDLKKRSGRKLADKDSRRRYVERMEEEGHTDEIDRIPTEQLELLEKVNLGEMTLSELQQLRDTVKVLVKIGRTKNKLIARKQAVDLKVVTDGVRDSAMGKGTRFAKEFKIKTSAEKRTLELQKGHFRKLIERWQGFVGHNRMPNYITKIYDGLLEIRDGFAQKYITEPLIIAQKSFRDRTSKVMDWKRKLVNPVKVKNFESQKQTFDNEGRRELVNKDTGMLLYALSLDNHGKMILKNSGYSDKMVAEVSEWIGTEARSIVHKAIDYLTNNQWNRMSPIYEKMSGRHLGRVSRYFPLLWLDKESNMTDIVQTELNERSTYYSPSGKIRALKKRVKKHGRGLAEFSFFKHLNDILTMQERYIAFALPIRDVNKVMINKEVREALRESPFIKMSKLNGEKVLADMDKFLKDVAFGRDKAADGLDKVAKILTQNFVVGVLGYNLAVAMRQPASYLAGERMVGRSWCVRSIRQMMIHPVEMVKRANEKSSLLRNRWLSQERSTRTMAGRKSTSAEFGQPGKWERFRNFSYGLTHAMDKTTVTIIWNAQYDKGMKLWADETRAIRAADEVIERSQPMGETVYLPPSMRGGAASRALMLFRNQLNKNYNMMKEAKLDFKIADKTGAKWLPAGAKLSYAYMMTILIPSIYIGITRRRRLPETEAELIQDMLYSQFGGAFLVGDVINAIMTVAQHPGWDIGLGEIGPIAAPFRQIQRGIKRDDIGPIAAGVGEAVGLPGAHLLGK